VFDIGPVAFEVDIFAGERLQFGEGRFPDRIEAYPEIDSLAANQEGWKTVPVRSANTRSNWSSRYSDFIATKPWL
jgi:hypothetical protein